MSAGVTEEMKQIADSVLPSMLAVAAAWLMTLVQNVYYKVKSK